jgi:protein TonB
MPFSKLDIYGSEWLELVFKNRNKSYGAYDLRKHYAATVLKALGIAFLAIGAMAYGGYLFFKPAPIAAHPVPNEVTYVPKYEVIPSPARPTQQPASHHSHLDIQPIQPIIRQPQTPTPVNIAVPTTPQAIPQQPAEEPVDITKVYPAAYADAKPQPDGGAQGWMSYLQKNLVYPEDARHQGISGKVWLSFVVERDGSLSDITIDQPAGHGFDEEAVRVLKQSPTWQAGSKDGQAIRIKYKLPITFRMVK